MANNGALKIKRSVDKATQTEIDNAFPDVDPGFQPFGSRLIVQIRTPKEKSGLLIMTDEAKEVELWNTQIAKVRAVGPVAFKNRTNLQDWPEGDWCQPGDFVRIPKYNQDKWIVETEEGTEEVEEHIRGRVEKKIVRKKKQVLFMMVNDLDILAKKIGNPLEVKAYI